MNFDSTLLTYFMNAGMVVKCVMVLLILASVLSWTYILQRGFYLRSMHHLADQFEDTFWAHTDLAKTYSEGIRRQIGLEGMEAIFHAGYKEFLRLNKQLSHSAEAILESVKRAMRVSVLREQDKLESQLPFLATVGSISPYVGLFGTVWGIMVSFRGLANVQQATISMVAPGIAEALIATAMGLFAAIPAVIAYNRYSTEVNRLLNRFDSFQDELANVLFRQARQPSSVKSDLMAELE